MVRSGKTLTLIILFALLLSFQVSGQYDFVADNTVGCTPMKVKFTFQSTALVDSVATYYWSFGNGETSYLMNPDTVVFNTDGTFDPTLVLVFDNGTETWLTKTEYITVNNTVHANFNYSTPTESYFYYVFEHIGVIDTSVTYNFTWDIEEFAPRTGPVQEITFPRVDTFTVTLLVSDEFGCSNSVSKEIAVLEELILPNVFTPDGDSNNDFFIIKSNGNIPLHIRIFTRTGILVYEGEGPVITWDGITASGDKLKSGIYFYVLEAQNGDPDKLYSKSGFVHLYRK